MISLGLPITAQLRSSGGVDPFASLMTTLLSNATQLIAHPLEYGSMFQDRAGTTPVTEPGQLVGLALDHGFTGSKPVGGPELVTNGTFDTWAGDNPTGWTVTETGDDPGVSEVAEGARFFTSVTANRPVIQQAILTSGRLYELSIDIASITEGNVRVQHTLNGATTFTTSGIKTISFVASTSTVDIRTDFTSAPSDFVIRSVSVKELPGYHATAISDAARGVFREVDGKRYIEYNGINTAYATAALAAPLVDKAQVFSGVRMLSDATTIIIELSETRSANEGACTVIGDTGFSWGSRGSLLPASISSGVIPAPTTNVLTGLGDISGDIATLRIDGTQVAQSTADQGTGNYNPSGAYPLYYGARAGTSLFLEGNHYDTLGPITRFSATNATAAQVEAAAAYYTARVV